MNRPGPLISLAFIVLAICVSAAGQIRRDVFAYKVGPRPVISVRNQYGRITVSPTAVDRVVVTVVHSDAVQILPTQNENRVEMITGSQPAGPRADNVDYQVLVPPDACVILSTAAGSLSAENLQGDLIFEGTTASVDARSLRNAHVHVKTLSGPITLREIRGGNVDVATASGEVTLLDVSGPMVQVHSGSGTIRYAGNPAGGFFKLVSGTGNINVSLPSAGLARFKARSVKGKLDHQVFGPQLAPLPAQGNALLQPALASFEIHSLRGNISLREASK
ncbi:MAG TPA: DUF4097 family beta strand repeat-containing protein [Terriglobia bacterium]|jgi:hypothetical protein|nr:DUF4097 family beta strand repeat-containing protein [Terriglobia bacterium]